MSYTYDIALSYASPDVALVERVYRYLKAEGMKVFFAPSQEGQTALSGLDQQEAFYRVFGLESRYAALFVSKDYIKKRAPMEEAEISFVKHGQDGSVIPIYLDGTPLPKEMLDPEITSYFESDNAAEIANHLVAKVKGSEVKTTQAETSSPSGGSMNIIGNKGVYQGFVQNLKIQNGRDRQ